MYTKVKIERNENGGRRNKDQQIFMGAFVVVASFLLCSMLCIFGSASLCNCNAVFFHFKRKKQTYITLPLGTFKSNVKKSTLLHLVGMNLFSFISKTIKKNSSNKCVNCIQLQNNLVAMKTRNDFCHFGFLRIQVTERCCLLYLRANTI